MLLSRLLSLKSILSTQIYVGMKLDKFSVSSVDKYVVKVCPIMEEIAKLMEVGFKGVTEFEGKKLFRKRE